MPCDPTRAGRKERRHQKEWESWNAPFKPSRLIGNIHYVRASGIDSFLITTPEGYILLDTGFETTVPRNRGSVAQLGSKDQWSVGSSVPPSGGWSAQSGGRNQLYLDLHAS